MGGATAWMIWRSSGASSSRHGKDWEERRSEDASGNRKNKGSSRDLHNDSDDFSLWAVFVFCESNRRDLQL